MKKEMIVILGLLLVVAPLVSAQPQGVTPELDKKFNNASPSEKVEAIVVMQDRPSQAQISTIKSDGASVDKEFEIVNAVSVSVPEQAAQAIANRPFVDRIEPDYSVELFLDQSAGQINADDVWNENTTGKDVDVSIVDTGIDNDHSQLEQEAQKDFTGEGTDDLNGHGTHVAGIVASTDNNYRGVSYNADLFDAKALNEEGSGTASDVIDAIEWSVNNGAEVISLSLGAKVDSCDGNDILSEAVDNAVSEGSVAVVAAGNYGPDSETITIPGCSRKAITVGAVDDSNNMADFSSRGPTADGRTKPDVVAPGVSISSTWNDGSYNSISGTSMATPHVSGLAALMLSENQDLSTSEVKNEITSNAEDLGYESNSQGSGLVDALASYNSVKVNETKNETSNETEEDNETSGETNKTLPPGLERMSELPPGLKKKAGSLPGSAGHRFERFFENINLAFTFDSKKKVEKETEFASERVAESSVLFYKNKTEKATETLKEARENLRDARKTAKGLEIVGENSSELREKIKNTTNRSTQVLKEVYERVPEQAKESIRNAINQSTKNESSTKGSKNNTPRGKGFFGNDSESPGKDGQKGPDNERDSDKSVANPGPEDNPGLEGEANAGASANAGSQGASANAGAEASVSVSAPTSASQGQGSSNSDSASNSGNSGSGGNSGNGNSGSPGNSGTSGGNGGGPGNAPVTGNTIFKDFFTS